MSVVIAACDAAATIGRAVRSALAEAEAGEVIVVDDGSRDATLAAARAGDDGSGRLKLLRFADNRGPAAARNAAIAAGTAPLIAVLDADDHFLPGRFARLGGDGWDLIADNIVFLSETAATPLDGAALARLPDRRRRLDLAEFVVRNIARPGRPRAELGFVKPVMRRAALAGLGLRYDERLRLGEDFILYATALARGARFELSARCGYVAIERAGSLSGRHRTADLAALAAAAAPLPAEVATPSDRRLLARHLAALEARLAHRRFLDRRAEAGLAAAVAALLPVPHRLFGVAAAVLRDKARRPPGLPPEQRLLFAAAEFGA